MSKRLFTDEQSQFIHENYLTMSYKELGEIFGVTARQIGGHVCTQGWSKEKSKQRVWNKKYFDVIDTPEKAYWLGFFFADGYVAYNQKRRNYEASIQLQEGDVDALKRLAEQLGIDYNDGSLTFIEKDVNYPQGTSGHVTGYVLRTYSKHFCDSLISRGVVPNKTYRPEYPTIENFCHAFVRGFFDGDGCLSLFARGYVEVHFTNPNEEFLKYIKNIVEEEIGVSGTIYKENDMKYRLYYFRTADTRKFLDWIYQDDGSYRLPRKYNRYLSYYGLAA